MQTPNDEVMRAMSKIAIEQATEMFASLADDFANTLSPDVTGAQAMEAFAAAIRARNMVKYPMTTTQ